MVPATAHMLQEIISLQQPYMSKCSPLAAECCFHKFFLGVEDSSRFSRMSSYMKALTFPSGATNDVFPPLWLPTHTTIEPPSHRAGSWIQYCRRFPPLNRRTICLPSLQSRVQRPLVLKTTYSQCPTFYAP